MLVLEIAAGIVLGFLILRFWSLALALTLLIATLAAVIFFGVWLWEKNLIVLEFVGVASALGALVEIFQERWERWSNQRALKKIGDGNGNA